MFIRLRCHKIPKCLCAELQNGKCTGRKDNPSLALAVFKVQMLMGPSKQLKKITQMVHAQGSKLRLIRLHLRLNFSYLRLEKRE